MPVQSDIGLGVHKQNRRHLEFTTSEIFPGNTNIAAAGVQVGPRLYAESFSHFHGILVCQAAAPTTMLVQVQPARGDGAAIFAADFFTVATLAVAVAQQRYTFYWGEARGLLTGAGATGSTYCFSKLFRMRLNVTGATGVDLITIESLECY